MASGKTVANRVYPQPLTNQYYAPPSTAYPAAFSTSYNTGPNPYAIDAYGGTYGNDQTGQDAFQSVGLDTTVAPAGKGASGATKAKRASDAQKAIYLKGLLVVGSVIAIIYVTRRFNLLSGGR